MKTQRREILAEFWCDEDGKLWLNSMSVSEPRVGRTGEAHRSLDHYDVDWCKRDGQYLFHQSGGGGSWPQEARGIYWRTDGFRVKERAAQWCSVGEDGAIDRAATKYTRMRNRTRRLRLLPKEFRGAKHFEYRFPLKAIVAAGDLLDWLEQNGQQEESVFCGECGDDLPGDDLCVHCWWCEAVGWYVTPTEGEVCFDADCRGCSRHRRTKHEKYWREKRCQAYIAPTLMARQFPEVRA